VSVDRGEAKWQKSWDNGGGVTIGPDGMLYGFNYASGYPAMPYLNKISPNGSIIATTWDDLPDGGYRPPTFGLNDTLYITFEHAGTGSLSSYRIDGSLQWKLDTEPTNSACAISNNGTIYFCTYTASGDRGHLVAVNPDGSLIWQLDVGSCYSCDPALAKDGTIYVLSGISTTSFWGKWLNAVYPNGTMKWSIPLDSLPGYPVVKEDGTVLVSCRANGSGLASLVAVSPDGSISWTTVIDSPFISNPSLDSSGNVYVVSEDGRLWSCDRNGAIRWSVGYAEFGSYSVAPAISMNGLILVTGMYSQYNVFGQYVTTKYELSAFNLDGGFVWKCQIIEGWGSSVIIAYDGTIIVANAYGIQALADETDWDIPLFVVAMGLIVLLLLMPPGKKHSMAVRLLVIPFWFVLWSIFYPSESWYDNLAFAIIVTVILEITIWLQRKRMKGA
jgi:hypothetical protein